MSAPDFPTPPPVGDTSAAVEFLGCWHGDQPRILITIHPATSAAVRHDFEPHEIHELRAAIDAAQGRLNCYTPVNVAGLGRTSPTKKEMQAARALHVDADLKDTGLDREALLMRLRSFDPPPSLIIFSGGGFWALWLLDAPYADGDGWRDRVEQVCEGLHKTAGADPTCRNVNRLMRVPHTVNVLSKTKRAAGRLPSESYVVDEHWGRKWSFARDRLPQLPESMGEAKPDRQDKGWRRGGKDGRGKTRSDITFGIACDANRANRTYEQFIEEVYANPETAAWAREKGEHNDGRELGRVWEHAGEEVEKERRAKEPIPLGYTRDNNFALILPESRLLVKATATQLTNAQYLMGLAPRSFWTSRFPPKDPKRGFNGMAAGGYLIEGCRRAGPFNPLSIRGSGVWRDYDGTIVVNLGGPVPSPRYICFEPIRLDTPATFDTARLFELLRIFSWKNVDDAELVLGWLAIAPICGVLHWRPHIWTYGRAKCGKTTLHGLLKAVTSPLSLSCDGASSEAGIRQTIGPDSRAVIIDELESDHDPYHIKSVLKLVRSASSAEDPVLRGTPEGRAIPFALRATFALCSVNPSGMEPADESRIVLLQLIEHDGSNETARFINKEVAHFVQLGEAWCANMVSLAHLIPAAIEKIEDALGGERRHKQNMATLLAGAFVALNARALTEAEAVRIVARCAGTVEIHAEAQDRDDGIECLNQLFSDVIPSSVGAYPLGDWVAVAANPGLVLNANNEPDEHREVQAAKFVEMYDMRIEHAFPDKDGWLLIKNRSPAIEKIFERTKWARGAWVTALRSVKGAVVPDGTQRFRGQPARYTKIPLALIPEPIRVAPIPQDTPF